MTGFAWPKHVRSLTLAWCCPLFVSFAISIEKFELCAGDKTIFRWLGLGRDRNAINEGYLILGIPGMFAGIRHSIGIDEQRLRDYNLSIGKLAILMQEKDTALMRMVDFLKYSRFHYAQHNQKRLAEALHKWFEQQHADYLPICSDCAKASDQAEVCFILLSCCQF